MSILMECMASGCSYRFMLELSDGRKLYHCTRCGNTKTEYP